MSFAVAMVSNPVVDITFAVESFPVLPAQHQTIQERLVTAGGPGNTLICGVRFGLRMIALGNVGEDEFGHFLIERLAAEGVDTARILLRLDRSTAVTVALAAPNGEHVFLAYSGGFDSGPAEFPAGWVESLTSADALLLDGYTFRAMGPAVNRAALALARPRQIPVFFDPGPEIEFMERNWLAEMLAQTTVALVTRDEASQIVGETLPDKVLAERIRQLGPALVLLKLGGDGILGHSAAETIYQPGFVVPVRDLTGAGDSVAAAAIYAYLQDFPLDKLLVLANATGAAAVQKLGAGGQCAGPVGNPGCFATSGAIIRILKRHWLGLG